MSDNKFNLNLAFLYQEPLDRDYIIGGGPDLERIEWEQKYELEEDIFLSYVKDCSLDDLIYLIVHIFKVKYPNIIRLAYKISKESNRIAEDKVKYFDFYRDDIIYFNTDLFLEPILDEFLREFRDVYETSVSLKFKKPFSILSIEEALEGTVYSKLISDELVQYDVKNSPIKSIDVKADSFTIHINREKVILYYKL